MKIVTASIGISVGALLALPAHAGPCSIEIETLMQALAGTGAGANSGASGTAALPKAPTSAGDLPANPLVPGQAPKATGSDTIPKAPSTAGSLPANPLEATTQGNAAADAGATPSNGSMADGSMAGGDAAASLQRARELDQAGDEAGCMAEVAKAKELIGIQ
jgi:hypothetical protein